MAVSNSNIKNKKDVDFVVKCDNLFSEADEIFRSYVAMFTFTDVAIQNEMINLNGSKEGMRYFQAVLLEDGIREDLEKDLNEKHDQISKKWNFLIFLKLIFTKEIQNSLMKGRVEFYENKENIASEKLDEIWQNLVLYQDKLEKFRSNINDVVAESNEYKLIAEKCKQYYLHEYMYGKLIVTDREIPRLSTCIVKSDFAERMDKEYVTRPFH